MRTLLYVARRAPSGWAGKRLAFALRALALRALGGRPLDVETLGCRMRLYPGRNVAEKNLLFTPQYFDPQERAFLAGRLADDCTFIDAGANVGGYALFVARQCGPRARILAIEPQPDMFARLVYNIALNGFANVKALDIALADQDGEITLFVDPDNQGETSMRVMSAEHVAEQVRVPAKALATVMSEEALARVDALKIDVEGAEDLVLEPFFRDVRPALWPGILIVEDSPARWSIDLHRLIRDRGYASRLRTRTNVIYERG